MVLWNYTTVHVLDIELKYAFHTLFQYLSANNIFNIFNLLFSYTALIIFLFITKYNRYMHCEFILYINNVYRREFTGRTSAWSTYICIYTVIIKYLNKRLKSFRFVLKPNEECRNSDCDIHKCHTMR